MPLHYTTNPEERAHSIATNAADKLDSSIYEPPFDWFAIAAEIEQQAAYELKMLPITHKRKRRGQHAKSKGISS